MLRAAEMSQKWAANLIRAMNRDTVTPDEDAAMSRR
jgi:hypothetical protein